MVSRGTDPETLSAFRSAFGESVERDGTQVVEVVTDAEASHRFRERLEERVADELGRLSTQ